MLFRSLHRSHMPTDIRVWNHQSSICSVKSANHFILDSRNEGQGGARETWSWIWMLKLPPKIKLFLWKCANHRLPTKSIIFNHSLQTNQICPRCVKLETPIHVLRDCTFARSIWMSFPPNMLIPDFFNLNLHNWCKQNTKVNTQFAYVPWNVLFAFTVWAI